MAVTAESMDPIGGNQNHLSFRAECFDLSEDLNPVHVRKPQVRDDHVCLVLPEKVSPFPPVSAANDFVTFSTRAS